MSDAHHHHHDYVAANAKHFNDTAQTYRTEFSLEIAKRCATVIRKHYAFDPEKTTVLDFACGPGLIAFELVPHAKRIVGADAAQGMVDVFNQTVEQTGLAKEKCQAILVEQLNDERFDVIL